MCEPHCELHVLFHRLFSYSLILLFSYSLILLFSYSLILFYSFTLLLFYSFTRFLASSLPRFLASSLPRFSASIARGCACWINSISTHYQLPPQSQVDVLEGE
ncbi:TPA: hypothetical protein I7776_12900 [Vibrio vulnificus]|nr:hypothetical protein [Vibrio vulnificus]